MSDRARYWQRLVTAWEKNGLSQAEFCRRRKVKAVNFGWWKRKLESISKSHPGASRSGSSRTGLSPRSAKPRFVEFRMADVAAPAYEVVLRGGRMIRLPQNFDPAVVAQLVVAVESC
jgi:hypothetical protein